MSFRIDGNRANQDHMSIQVNTRDELLISLYTNRSPSILDQAGLTLLQGVYPMQKVPELIRQLEKEHTMWLARGDVRERHVLLSSSEENPHSWVKVEKGDAMVDHHGKVWYFQMISQVPHDSSNGRIVVSDPQNNGELREFYPFRDCKIVHQTVWSDMQIKAETGETEEVA